MRSPVSWHLFLVLLISHFGGVPCELPKKEYMGDQFWDCLPIMPLVYLYSQLIWLIRCPGGIYFSLRILKTFYSLSCWKETQRQVFQQGKKFYRVPESQISELSYQIEKVLSKMGLKPTTNTEMKSHMFHRQSQPGPPKKHVLKDKTEQTTTT